MSSGSRRRLHTRGQKVPQIAANDIASSRQRARSFEDEPKEPATVADAISSIAVVSALVFGFAASTFVAVMIDSPGNEWTELPRIGTFCLCMAVVATMSGYATVYLSLLFYFLKRLHSMEAELVTLYLTSTASERHFACGLTWTALATYFVALSMLGSEVLPWKFSVPCTVVRSGGHKHTASNIVLMSRIYRAGLCDGRCARLGDLVPDGASQLDLKPAEAELQVAEAA